ncbi:hypothetical protein HYU12_00320 [Candidatus Woesearchaeota archaeon]|nr:hypothetical protein [Candidatus Woesearchaeota archaeon]
MNEMKIAFFRSNGDSLSTEYNILINEDMKDYAGKWVAVLGKQIIADNSSLSKLLKFVEKKYEGKKPMFTRVQKGNVAMY